MVRVKNRVITVSEFERITSSKRINGVEITEQDVEVLRLYLDNPSAKSFNDQADINDFLRPIRNGVQVNNYVGILRTSTGLTIEVLPKIYGKSVKKDNDQELRALFLKMLKTVRRINGKNFEVTNLNTRRDNLLEVFISMFLSESDSVIKRGLKSTYVTLQSNNKFLKGKLLMANHLRKNNINQSNFYTEFDEFLSNSPENQLIKTTLELLLKISNDNSNLRIIREQLSYFEFISVTRTPDITFQRVNLGRNHKYYEQTLLWCEIFLSGQTFTSFGIKSKAIAVLFPMEKLFEAYIAALVKKKLKNHQVFLQDSQYSLFDFTSQFGRDRKNKKVYYLRPDLVVRADNKMVIIDTKWKILDKKGPSQADLYQMYAYYTRYTQKEKNVSKVILLYPYTDDYEEKEFGSVSNSLEITADIQVRFVDLMSESIEDDLVTIIDEC